MRERRKRRKEGGRKMMRGGRERKGEKGERRRQGRGGRERERWSERDNSLHTNEFISLAFIFKRQPRPFVLCPCRGRALHLPEGQPDRRARVSGPPGHGGGRSTEGEPDPWDTPRLPSRTPEVLEASRPRHGRRGGARAGGGWCPRRPSARRARPPPALLPAGPPPP